MNYLEAIKALYTLPDTANFGFSESEIKKAEERLNITFPQSLRQYYLTLGKNEAVNQTFFNLLPPDQIYFTDDKYLVFYYYNEQVQVDLNLDWGIYEKDLSSDSPKVYVSHNTRWHLDSENIEDFLLIKAYWNGVNGGLKYTAYIPEDGLTPEVINKVQQNWKEQIQGCFTNDNLEIILLTTDFERRVNEVLIGSNHKEKYDNIIEKLSVKKWESRS